jgi:hypothetical protein
MIREKELVEFNGVYGFVYVEADVSRIPRAGSS